MSGKNKEEYEQSFLLKTLGKKSGCKKYNLDTTGKDTGSEIGLLLFENDSCSLSTKIHYAQISGAKLLLLKYVDDNISEAEVVRSSFEGVRIPIFMLKNSDANIISEVLNA